MSDRLGGGGALVTRTECRISSGPCVVGRLYVATGTVDRVTTTWWLVLLYLVALLCEGYGLWAIVQDVRKTTEVFRNKSGSVHMHAVGSMTSSGWATGAAVDPATLPVEDRLVRIEAQLPQLQASIRETADSLRADLTYSITTSADQLREHFQSELAALAKTVEGALYVPEPVRRWRGPVALGFGILLGAAGNIWSALMPT